MKNRKLLLGLLPFLLSGCYIESRKGSSAVEDVTVNIDAELVFNTVIDENAAPYARVMWGSSYYHFPENIQIEEKPVAGDQLWITFEGEPTESICYVTYPGDCYLEGKVKDYGIRQTNVTCLNIDLVEGATVSQYLRSHYTIFTNYVVLDEEGRYVALDEYDGLNTLYLSESISNKEYVCSCPEGAQCGPCPNTPYIVGIYAYDPRQTK
jgi:hypothetical protein